MKIVITENEDFSQKAIQELSTLGTVTTFNISSKEELIEEIADADVIFIRLRFKLDQTILKKAKKLKYILTATTGLDHIDTTYFESIGGKVISLRGETQFLNTIPSTAEHTWALLLSLMRNLPQAYNDVKQGYWRRDLFKGHNLLGKKIGILGLGRVGTQVAHYAKAFGMQVAFYDVVQKQNTNLIDFNSPQELFAWADIISIHIPLNPSTQHFINKELIDNIKEDAVMINTSRGAVIDENYLIQKLQKKAFKGYATDVLENELENNTATNQLIQLANLNNNIIITPHIAGATYESMHMTENFIVQKFFKNI